MTDYFAVVKFSIKNNSFYQFMVVNLHSIYTLLVGESKIGFNAWFPVLYLHSNNAMVMMEMQDTIQDLQREITALAASPSKQTFSRASTASESTVDPSIVFSRLDADRNQKALKRGLGSHKVSVVVLLSAAVLSIDMLWKYLGHIDDKIMAHVDTCRWKNLGNVDNCRWKNIGHVNNWRWKNIGNVDSW